MKEGCDRLWEIDALREGRLLPSDVDANARHRAICAECRERFRVDEKLAGLGKSLQAAEVEPLHARRLRGQVLRRAATPLPHATRPVHLALGVAVVLLAAGGALLARRPPTQHAVVPAPSPAASATARPSSDVASVVVASADADWSRQRDSDVERIALRRGTVSITVRKQQPFERFLVDLPDGQIEVRGTRFDVTVNAEVTETIHVQEGVVAFLRAGMAETTLRAGDAWERRPTVAAPARKVAVRVPTQEPADDRAALDYEDAMAAYRTRDYELSRKRFGDFLRMHPRAKQAEDAAFLEASSAAHAGHRDLAATLAEQFLGSYPSSFHARDAAFLVARAARERGECARARAVLRPWATSDNVEVVETLGVCAP